MKRLFAFTMALLMLLGCISLTALAEDSAALSAEVYVTVANQGTLVVPREKITVSDRDANGTLTVDEALFAAHEAAYDGGAEAGYASAATEWGLSITKLWGNESGNFGYYVNNAAAWSLEDPVKQGDSLNAFVYADGESYSDTFCWFDTTDVSAHGGEAISLTLTASGYDGDWNPITLPVEGAVITVNGEKTAYTTDADGKVSLKIEQGGRYVISAVSDSQTLVPPVCLATVASGDTVTVYVTVSDQEGKLVLVQEEITVTDVDEDGKLTVNDALYAAHEKAYDGGAKAGYGYESGEYGLSLTKLWGTANGGSYGYYVNDRSALSLADQVADGDRINAFVYTDLTAWSDTYCWFDQNTVSAKAGQAIRLTLSAYSYDDNWNPVPLPVAGATLTVNGEKTAFRTDENGKVTVVFEEEGVYQISAVSVTQVLVPPVCVATVSAGATTPDADHTQGTVSTDESPASREENPAQAEGTSPETGDSSCAMLFVLLMLVSLGGLAVLFVAGKKSYEK